jgi:hypothetical protein
MGTRSTPGLRARYSHTTREYSEAHPRNPCRRRRRRRPRAGRDGCGAVLLLLRCRRGLPRRGVGGGRGGRAAPGGEALVARRCAGNARGRRVGAAWAPRGRRAGAAHGVGRKLRSATPMDGRTRARTHARTHTHRHTRARTHPHTRPHTHARARAHTHILTHKTISLPRRVYARGCMRQCRPGEEEERASALREGALHTRGMAIEESRLVRIDMRARRAARSREALGSTPRVLTGH